jgi:uncharacterized protein (TIGR03435 family)
MKDGPGTNSPGRVTCQLAWLDDFLSKAYDREIRCISGPSWISDNDAPLYTFTAVMPPATSKHDFELMLQAFLIEQFRMKIHHELKMFPAYDLVVASGGTNLKTAADPDGPDNTLMMAPKIDSEGFPVLPPGHGHIIANNRGYHAAFQSYAMSEFAEWVTTG